MDKLTHYRHLGTGILFIRNDNGRCTKHMRYKIKPVGPTMCKVGKRIMW